MSDTVCERTTIQAPPEACFAVALDFERYPEWARGLKQAVVLERDGDGRGTLVRFRAAGMGYSTSYTLRYDHADPTRLSWALVEGDLTRKLDGSYQFLPVAGKANATEVVYDLVAELVVPLPGFIKRRTQLRIMHTALRELKSRVEDEVRP